MRDSAVPQYILTVCYFYSYVYFEQGEIALLSEHKKIIYKEGRAMNDNAVIESCVLVITRMKDSTADYVLQRMTERGISCFRLNAENFGKDDIVLKFPNVRDSVLSIGDTRITIGGIRGIWLRRLTKPQAHGISEPEAQSFAESELDFTLRWFIGLLGNYCPVVDSEARILEGRNKFDQLVVAEKFGLNIPTTLITNDPTVAKDFVEQHGEVAIKSIAGYGQQAEGGFYTIYTNIVTEEILNRFESIRMAPVCLQEYIGKEFELRVTIVGERVFCCQIDSQSTSKTQIDCRRQDSETPYSIATIDRELSDRLVAMMKHYGIRLASFDLIVTPDGRTVFLEMNPATQFLWIEKLTGMPIADAIVDEILVQCRA